MNYGNYGSYASSGGYHATWATEPHYFDNNATNSYGIQSAQQPAASSYDYQQTRMTNQPVYARGGRQENNAWHKNYTEHPLTRNLSGNYGITGYGQNQWRSSIFSDPATMQQNYTKSIWAAPKMPTRSYPNKSSNKPTKQKSDSKKGNKEEAKKAEPIVAVVKKPEAIAAPTTASAKTQTVVVKKNSSKKSSSKGEGNRKMNFGNNARGGYGYRGRGGRKIFRKRDNKQDDIPFNTVPEGEPFIAFPVSFENILCFHGFSSIFTTQHMFPVLIDGKIYESCDHFYQIEKTRQLCGKSSDKMTATVRDENGKRLDGKVGFRSHEEKGYSALAKEMIRLAGISKEKVEEWRHTNGLEIIQKALMAKVSQCLELRESLQKSGDKILIHAYAGDAIYGSGTRMTGIKFWCDEMQKNEAKLVVPMRFPLTVETVKHCPVVGKGRNILGVIMMQLRNLVLTEQVKLVDMSLVFDGLIQANPAPNANHANDNMDDEMNGFTIGGGAIQPPISA